MRTPTLRSLVLAPLRAGLVVLALALPSLRPALASVEIQRVVSPGGIEAWLVEDHRLPLVALRLDFQAGAARDPAGKPGVAYMTSIMLDEGAGPLDSNAFQARLKDGAIKLSFSVGKDSYVGQMEFLSDVTDEAFSLLGLAVTEPRFDEEALERMRAAALAGVRRTMSDPSSLGDLAWTRAMFGADHPYSRPTEGTLTSLPRITQADLQGFVGTHFTKSALLITVVGDITAEQLAGQLDQTFGALPQGQPLSPLPAALQADGRLVQVPLEVPQAVIGFGHGWIPRNDPRWNAARLANHIVGAGSFTSRLMNEVREKRGLTYGIYTYPTLYDGAAVLTGRSSTVVTRASETKDAIREEWAKLRAEGVTPAEVEGARAYMVGSMPLRLTTTDDIANIMLSMRQFDLPIDYLDTWVDAMKAVPEAEVQAVSQTLYDPDALTFVVVGEIQGLEPDQVITVEELFQDGAAPETTTQ